MRLGEKGENEKDRTSYMKWMLGMNAKTPGYLVREELQRGKA